MKTTTQTVFGHQTTKIKIRWSEGFGTTLNGVISAAFNIQDCRKVVQKFAYGDAATYDVDGTAYDVFIDHDGHPDGAMVTIITAV